MNVEARNPQRLRCEAKDSQRQGLNIRGLLRRGLGKTGLATTGNLTEENGEMKESQQMRMESCCFANTSNEWQTTLTRQRTDNRNPTHDSSYRSDSLEGKETKSNDDRVKSNPGYMRNQIASLSANGFKWISSSRFYKCRSFDKYNAFVELLRIQRKDNPNHFLIILTKPRPFAREFSWSQKEPRKSRGSKNIVVCKI